ncbi:uncharacterized protein PAC_01251 [Phialocephala subalpina]|uniref:Heterokaryon incompatibility domain-containing protein n=1 Tax=Phialocephala subalpina TaxID=576137 RepID=A0A1L7WF40_9HELO|nr:uncharacterized protein PAC_01251 [Phialocephala subalpina]
MSMMTTENFDSLRKDGSLSSDRPDIPSVLKDAMELVSRIGERYLWVDALCIQQDSPEKHKDLARMDVIYSHALFTLIAVNGTDANVPLPGLRPRSRLPLKPVVHIADHVLISGPPCLDEVLKSSKYETRGWTLQERVLSRRCLYISEQGMYFQCNTSTWSETTGFKGHRREHNQLSKFNSIRLRGSVLAQTLGVGSSTRATLQIWSQALLIYYKLVELYSSRSLSYPDDVLNAFAGFSSVFAESCGGGFVAGLPTAVLAASLLWVSKSPFSRRPSCRGTLFPSWSWIGWEGPVTYLYSPPSNHDEGSTSETRSEMQNLEILLDDPSNASIRLNDFEDEEALLAVGIVQVFSLGKAHNVTVRARSAEPASEDLPPVDILRFHAWIVETQAFNIFQNRGISHPSSINPMLSVCCCGSKKRCGALFGVQQSDSARIGLGDCRFKLVAISRQKTSWKKQNDYPVLQALGISAYGEDWDFMNVMLIKRGENGKYFERAGMGVIRYKTYEKEVISYWASILLG